MTWNCENGHVNVHTPPTRLHRWSRHAVDGLFCSLLAVHGVLLLSHRYDWFQINDYVGRAMLIDLAATLIAISLALICLAFAVTMRHPFQFTLRSLLLLVISVAITSTWFGVEWKRERNEYELGVAIQQAGGRAGGPLTLLSRLLGDGHLVAVQNLEFGSKYKLPVTDTDLLRLKELRQLVSLSISRGEVTDSGLEHLREHHYLMALSLNDTKITDAGLVNLAKIGHIRHLSLEDSRITDEGLVHLCALRELSCVHLGGTKVTSEGIGKLLKALPNCEVFR